MEVERPDWSVTDLSTSYRDWLGYINANMNLPRRKAGSTSVEFVRNPAIAALVESGELFETVYFHYPKAEGSKACPGLSWSSTAASITR